MAWLIEYPHLQGGSIRIPRIVEFFLGETIDRRAKRFSAGFTDVETVGACGQGFRPVCWIDRDTEVLLVPGEYYSYISLY